MKPEAAMVERPYRIVCLLAREPGIILLEWILKSVALLPVMVFTHRRLPASEDPKRSQRPEYGRYAQLAEMHSFPLVDVDTREQAAALPGLLEKKPFDLLVSLSWRYLVDQVFLDAPRLAAVNLHRGELPGYEGGEPVRRMLEDGLGYAAISAHLMTARIDEGKVLALVKVPVDSGCFEPSQDIIERAKRKLYPYYAPTARRALNTVLADNGLKTI